MYGLGMRFRDISMHIKDMYNTDISHSTLSVITDKIIPQVKEWQSQPLDVLYTSLVGSHDLRSGYVT
jgi:transposase-like protein